MATRATNHAALNVGDRRTLPGSDITRIKTGTFTLNPASIADQAQAEQTVTVTGLTTADKVVLFPPAGFEALLVGGARVSAANEVKFVLGNLSGGAIDAASATWSYLAIRG
jgi:hypothetical protein